MNTIKLNGTDVEYNNIYYIAVDGNDTTGDGTKGNPFATYGKAFTLATNNDLIYFKKGNYNITDLSDTYGAFLYDYGKDISNLVIYAEPFTYIKMDNPINSTRDTSIVLFFSNTTVIGFIFDWNVTNKSLNYNKPLFKGDPLRGFIYNCHFIIRSSTSFSYANSGNVLQCINCQFDVLANPEGAYSGKTKFINCTMNLSSWNSAWGIATTSTILTGISYSSIYKIIPSNNVYGVYNADYKWFTSKFLITQGDNYYSVKDNALTELGIPTDDMQKQQWFDNYGVKDLKNALLTPDENGNKLIDSLDSKFEIRMMVKKS